MAQSRFRRVALGLLMFKPLLIYQRLAGYVSFAWMHHIPMPELTPKQVAQVFKVEPEEYQFSELK
jgi:hypothetical protein